eukprot:3938322-Rhodomonas_salina.2
MTNKAPALARAHIFFLAALLCAFLLPKAASAQAPVVMMPDPATDTIACHTPDIWNTQYAPCIADIAAGINGAAPTCQQMALAWDCLSTCVCADNYFPDDSVQWQNLFRHYAITCEGDANYVPALCANKELACAEGTKPSPAPATPVYHP